MRPEGDGDVGAEAEAQVIGLLGGEIAEHVGRRRPQLHHHLGGAHRQALAGAQVERHPAPAPRVDGERQRRVGLDLRAGGHARLLAVTLELAAHQLRRRHRAHRLQQLHLLVAQRLAVGVDRRLHGEQRHDLQQVVLDHVADRAGLLVELAAPGDAELSAMVTCTLATKLRFHTGSRKELAKRKNSRFCTASLPR